MMHLIALLVLVPAVDDPLLDWSAWEKYRATVVHPAATVKPESLRRARENIKRHAWAAQYARGAERGVTGWPERLTPAFLEQMIPATTPGESLFTPCPACRDQGKAWHPHGQWRWSSSDPERLACKICGTVFPNEEYPESVVLPSKYAPGQEFRYCNAEPMKIFSYIGRPSFSGNIRARKVEFMSGLCRRMAEAYALTGKPEYAQATRMLLLRFAAVYPRWLVHVGYGEYADMDPHVAAFHITRLPADELCPPPARPDRRLHTGYWTAGRARGVGMEAGFVREMVEAYEFVCTAEDGGRPVFSDAERRQIEHDLLLESTVLLVADKAVNNKSVGNATAVALVGMSTGHPGLVRFGLDIFLKTVDGWFLPDGGTSESWGYALMTLGGIQSLGQALAGYSDPPGYRDAEGRRIDGMDLYHQTAYGRVWAAMFNGLQGDLRYPPLADGHVGSGLGLRFAELMANHYPENGQFLALLKALAGDDLTRGDHQAALYARPAGLAERPAPPLAFPDYCYPALQIGYLRSGTTGRDSLLVLSASDWGNHHHEDSLNLYYWRKGHELLTDLGYLWDHPDKHNTKRTFAHNTVMVDGRNQATKGRGGRFTLFAAEGPLKVMEAESHAYPQANLYRRTVAQVEHAAGRHYLLDIFRVQGGKSHDYLFHGPNRQMELQTPALRSQDAPREGVDMTNVRGSDAPGSWRLIWTIDGARKFQSLWNGAPGELALVGDGWGQRDWHNTDRDAVLPYIVRARSASKGPTVFVTAFEDYGPEPARVTEVRQLDVPPAESENTVLVAVRGPNVVDYLVSCLAARPIRLQTPDGLVEVNAPFTLVRFEGRKRVLRATALPLP